MKALLTAGGRGSRLRPITHSLNKHLVPIANVPLLFQAIMNVRDIGVREIYINLNAGDTELPEIIGNGESFGVSITYIEQEEPKGLGHVLKLAESYLGDDEFVFYYGDNVLAGGLQKHYEAFLAAKSSCHLCLVSVDDPSQFGVAVVEGDHVVKTVEKPLDFVSNLAITGIQFYTSDIFKALDHIKPTPPKPPRTIAEMDIPPANQWLIDNGYKVSFSEITGWWKDTGKPSDLLAASELLLGEIKPMNNSISKNSSFEGPVRIEDNVKITNSTILGPVVIASGTTINNSTVGPNVSLDQGVHLDGVRIRESIVMRETTLSHVTKQINKSIIGRRVVLEKADDDNMQILIGDQGQILL